MIPYRRDLTRSTRQRKQLMTATAQPQPPLESEPIVLEGVSWETYESLLRDVEVSHQNVRVTYDRGRMVVTSPLPKHAKWKSLLGSFVEAIADEKGIPISPFGSTTWKRRDKRRGLEADECFYIQHEPQVRGKLEFDLRHDPPPDLAIEVDLRQHALDRQLVYAALGIPEVWRFEGNVVETVLLQADDSYRVSSTSAAFPFLKPAELKQFLDLFGTLDHNSIVRRVREWARTL